MTKIGDLSGDLAGEILSRVPLTSLIPVRCTCKTWNALSKKQILGEKAESQKKKKQQFLEFMRLNYRVCSLKFEDDFLVPSLKKVRIFDKIEVSQVYHCNGLLLCVAKKEEDGSFLTVKPEKDDSTRLMIWNPYLCQTKWIKPRIQVHRFDEFALGFDNRNGNHKILRFDFDPKSCIDVYDFTSDSWRVLDVRADSDRVCYRNGVSLKGNSYFFDQELTTEEEDMSRIINVVDYLVCFDFTEERFGPRLPLPFSPPSPCPESLRLSWVRDEKLSVFYKHPDTYEIMEIWVTSEIGPDALSWNKFLKVDTSLLNGLPYLFYLGAGSFFIDEEKKVVVFFDVDRSNPTTTLAYIIGKYGYFRSVDIGEAATPWGVGRLVCSSYVPSLVQLQSDQLG